MYGKSSSEPPNWSVHAEFTIHHGGPEDPANPPETRTERDDNGVRMTYTWTSQPSSTWATHSNHPQFTRSGNAPSESGRPGTYEFQRGNLLFSSSTPLRRPRDFHDAIRAQNPARLGVPDSGYNSELLSPSSFLSSVLPRRIVQPYNRKCRSTCSIVLSTGFNEECDPPNGNQNAQRAHSLRCQTPTSRLEPKDFRYYGCGDPWCYHSRSGGEAASFSLVQGTAEDSSMKTPSRTSTFTTSKTPTKSPVLQRVKMKDASVQTLEMVDKCTSPFLRSSSFVFGKGEEDEKKENKNGKRRVTSRRRTEPVFQRTHSPSSFTPDSLESQQVGKYDGSWAMRLKSHSEEQEIKLSTCKCKYLLYAGV